jgi:hypothetical protein
VPPNILRHFAADAEFLSRLPAELATEVQALRIGDSAWVGLPGEIFVEIGLAIKAAAPVPATFVIGLANDNLGYIATDKALREEGGYETFASRWSRAGAGAEGILRDAAADLLGGLFAG